MKKIILLFIIFIAISHLILATISKNINFPLKKASQIIIHFIHEPQDREEHKKWNHSIHTTVENLNKYLIQENLLTTKNNKVFFSRIDHDFGSFALHIPDKLLRDVIIQYLKNSFHNQGVPFFIDEDIPVQISQNTEGELEGVSLTLAQLEAAKRLKKNQQTKTDLIALKKVKNLPLVKEQLFWHQCIPTVGLRLEKPFYPLSYPFIPHMFSLWQLAPKKGEGVRVAVIDTGVAGASFQGDSSYKKNVDLSLSKEMLHENLNIVSHNGLDPIEQIVNLAYPHIQPQKFNQTEISQEIINWVYDYLNSKKIDKIVSYLKKNGKKDLFTAQGNLTAQGKQAIQEITIGPYGIVPNQGEPPLQIAVLQEPYDKKQVIKQLLPLAPISDKNVTYIAGHGSHTYGLIGGAYRGESVSSLQDDIGICGLAPNASVFMIKAFKNDGTSDKSTLISALKKAILYNADIASLSLKIADNIDITTSLSNLLEKMINLIPYVVAASGNSGNPYLKNYAGKIESYPARFATVEFDVGSFAYENMKCPISVFSQYQPDIGPKFVAPGQNILSSALIPNQKEDSMYLFMDGTSMATPIVAGFVALMLSEFQKDFTRDEMLNVCYTSAFRMHDSNEWKEKVLLGTPDMRTILFVLHVLRKAREDQVLKNLSFNKLLTVIYEIIFTPVRLYGKEYLQGADFTQDFMTYFMRAQQNQQHFMEKKFFAPKTLNEAIEYVINSLKAAYTEKQSITKVPILNTLKSKQEPNIFSHFSKNIQSLITTSEKKGDYWQKQAKRIRGEIVQRKK